MTDGTEYLLYKQGVKCYTNTTLVGVQIMFANFVDIVSNINEMTYISVIRLLFNYIFTNSINAVLYTFL